MVHAWTSGKTDEERKADIEIYLKQAKNVKQYLNLALLRLGLGG